MRYVSERSHPLGDQAKNPVVAVPGYIKVICVEVCIEVNVDGLKRLGNDADEVGILGQVDVVQIVMPGEERCFAARIMILSTHFVPPILPPVRLR